jgi:hypothetical protein
MPFIFPMNKKLYILFLFVIFYTFPAFSESKPIIGSKKLLMGETLKYKAKWGLLTIGTAFTHIDKKIYKIGNQFCYKIQMGGQTNGLAKLFYLNDSWVAYIDTHSFTTHRAFRSISEGNYRLSELTYFDHNNKKATQFVYNKEKKKYVLKKVYQTPENIRDVVAGFMILRLIDMLIYKQGDRFYIDGFYQDTGYHIDVIFSGKDFINTNKGKLLCYKLKPLIPKNKIFDGLDAIEALVSADKKQMVMLIKAKLVFGSITIEMQN